MRSKGSQMGERRKATSRPRNSSGWIYSNLYGFDGSPGSQDGYKSLAGVIFDTAGDLYGTTQLGGVGGGTVFELTPTSGGWVESILHNFAGGSDGASPEAPLIFDFAGNLYGTTYSGGKTGAGTIFQLSSNGNGQWTESVFRLKSADEGGVHPDAPVLLNGQSLYGTTSGIPGVVFKISQ
jgi:uncharacterized repeat protein (TIGR03803 family)